MTGRGIGGGLAYIPVRSKSVGTAPTLNHGLALKKVLSPLVYQSATFLGLGQVQMP